MLIRFWCDSDLTFSRGLHKNLVTVLYFSIINVLCGAGGDASFAPQTNLVLTEFVSYLRERGVLCVGNGSHFCKPVLMYMCNITFQVSCIVLSGVSGAGMLKRHRHNAVVTKHGTITQCCFNDGPASNTVGQH